jgi:hypothetical protein
MPTSLDNLIQFVSAERQHVADVNMCFVYFAALAETRRRGHRSNLFEALDHFKCLEPGLPRDCDDEMALNLREVITQFIENCPGHPNIGGAFHILRDLSTGNELQSYFISKLKFHHAQGDAWAVHSLCTVLTDLGMDVFRDENGAFMQSRSSCEAETNMGVARRFLERQDTGQGAAANQC